MKILFKLCLESVAWVIVVVFFAALLIGLKVGIYSCIISIPLFFSDLLIGTNIFTWKYALFGGVVALAISWLGNFMEKLTR